MTKERRDLILTMLRDIPIISTDQAAKFFLNNGSPSKRASEALTLLEKEKWIEGRRREIGKAKIWRLSSTGRKRLEIDKPPLAMNSPKIEHVLGIGDVYQTLVFSGRLAYFQYEPKDEMEGGKRIYCPDAFFLLKEPHRAYLLEYQRSSLSTTRWAAKWAVASAFFDSGAYKSARWQIAKIKFRPNILVITTQSPEVVQGGSHLPLLITKRCDLSLTL